MLRRDQTAGSGNSSQAKLFDFHPHTRAPTHINIHVHMYVSITELLAVVVCMRCANSPSRLLSHILPQKQKRRSKVGNGKCSGQSRRRTSVKFAPLRTHTDTHTLYVLSLSLYWLTLQGYAKCWRMCHKAASTPVIKFGSLTSTYYSIRFSSFCTLHACMYVFVSVVLRSQFQG